MMGANLLGGAIAGLGSLLGGIGQRSANRKARRVLDSQARENDAWFSREYYQDFTQRADTQALLGNMRDEMDRQYKRVADAAVVTGATPGAAALAKGSANELYGRTLSDLNGQGARFKEGIMNRYMDVKNNIASQKAASYSNQAQQWANSGMGITSGGLSLMGSSKW